MSDFFLNGKHCRLDLHSDTLKLNLDTSSSRSNNFTVGLALVKIDVCDTPEQLLSFLG